MRATRPAHHILLDLITQKILGEEYRSLSSSLCSLLHSPGDIFSSTPYTQTPSAYVPPSLWGIKIHTHKKQQENLQFCISESSYFWTANWKTKYSPPSYSKEPKLQVSLFTLLTLWTFLHSVYSTTNTLRHAMYITHMFCVTVSY